MIITLSHGSGGKATSELIDKIFARCFSNPILNMMEDSAVVDGHRKIAITTDSFVVTPLFFNGGDIGRLAVCGTVNDLLMRGAVPKYITSAFIIEEGADTKTLGTQLQNQWLKLRQKPELPLLPATQRLSRATAACTSTQHGLALLTTKTLFQQTCKTATV